LRPSSEKTVSNGFKMCLSNSTGTALQYGPIRDLLQQESRERIEKQRMHQQQNAKAGLHMDDLDASFESYTDVDDDFFSPQKGGAAGAGQQPPLRVKRSMTFADFAAVLSKSSTAGAYHLPTIAYDRPLFVSLISAASISSPPLTNANKCELGVSPFSMSAEAASSYKHAEAERHFERDQRGRAGGGGAGASGRGAGPGSVGGMTPACGRCTSTPTRFTFTPRVIERLVTERLVEVLRKENARIGDLIEIF
jgi:hypothetical protein